VHHHWWTYTQVYYKCLSILRDIAQLYTDLIQFQWHIHQWSSPGTLSFLTSWLSMFKQCKTKEPYWWWTELFSRIRFMWKWHFRNNGISYSESSRTRSKRSWTTLVFPPKDNCVFSEIAKSEYGTELLKKYACLFNHNAEHPNSPVCLQKKIKYTSNSKERHNHEIYKNPIYPVGTIFREWLWIWISHYLKGFFFCLRWKKFCKGILSILWLMEPCVLYL
jgi:hypothetical protein